MTKLLHRDSKLTSISNAIRTKKGVSNHYKHSQMSEAIDTISGGTDYNTTLTLTSNKETTPNEVILYAKVNNNVTISNLTPTGYLENATVSFYKLVDGVRTLLGTTTTSNGIATYTTTISENTTFVAEYVDNIHYNTCNAQKTITYTPFVPDKILEDCSSWNNSEVLSKRWTVGISEYNGVEFDVYFIDDISYLSMGRTGSDTGTYGSEQSAVISAVGTTSPLNCRLEKNDLETDTIYHITFKRNSDNFTVTIDGVTVYDGTLGYSPWYQRFNLCALSSNGTIGQIYIANLKQLGT